MIKSKVNQSLARPQCRPVSAIVFTMYPAKQSLIVIQRSTTVRLQIKNNNPLRRKNQEQNYRFAHQIPSWVNPSDMSHFVDRSRESSWWNVLNKHAYKQKIAITTGICCLSRINILTWLASTSSFENKNPSSLCAFTPLFHPGAYLFKGIGLHIRRLRDR